MNGGAAHTDSAVAAAGEQIALGAPNADGLPRMIVVDARAAGYGGFAR
jgi:hypothetical protein